MDKWKMVPVEPSEEMVIAFAETWYSKRRAIDDCEMEDCYRAMLAAAPAPAFDEAAERAAHKAWYLERCGVGGAAALIASWQAWAACAKRKAGLESK